MERAGTRPYCRVEKDSDKRVIPPAYRCFWSQILPRIRRPTHMRSDLATRGLARSRRASTESLHLLCQILIGTPNTPARPGIPKQPSRVGAMCYYIHYISKSEQS